MKLFRFGPAGAEKPGIVGPRGELLDVSSLVRDFDEAFFADGGVARLAAAIFGMSFDRGALPTAQADARFGPPIARPSKIVCVGLNYADHAAETKCERPSEPVLFMKATTALCGPFDDVVLPRGSTNTDWEVELALVIGKRASYVTPEDAPAHIAGYTLLNDYSERAFQKDRGGQWVKGKSCDTFAPLGPYLVTADEIPATDGLTLWLKVNGELRQRGTTDDMIFSAPFLVSYISQFMTLLPGDVISTGTPAGVGAGMSPPRFLRAGDLVELGIDGICSAQQRIVAHPSESEAA